MIYAKNPRCPGCGQDDCHCTGPTCDVCLLPETVCECEVFLEGEIETDLWVECGIQPDECPIVMTPEWEARLAGRRSAWEARQELARVGSTL